MQKKLIALAIAGLASTAAFAQSNVTIYGVVDASIDITDSGDTTGATGDRTTKISSNSSRLGFKGTEDLGNGLKAVFQIETGIDADGTGGTADNASRNTYIGLAADGWGQMIVGRYDTPYKTATSGWNLFGDHLADYRNLMGRGVINFDGRAPNTLRYDLTTNGFSLAAAYVAGAEGTTLDTDTKGKGLSVSGSYTFNAFTGVLAYEKHDFGTIGTNTMGTINGTIGGNAVVLAANDSEKAWKAGLGYKEGPIRASLVYEKVDFDLAAGNSERKAWTVGGGYTFAGNNEVKLAYTKADELDGVPSSGAKQWAIGVDHVMSKRTKVYAEYVKLSNESGAAYGLTGAGSTGSTAALGADSDPSAFQFGVKHSF